MEASPVPPGPRRLNIATRTQRFFELKGGRLSESQDRRLTETVKLGGLNGDVVETTESVRAGMHLDCGCLVTSPKEVAGECRLCGALLCKEHAGTCQAEAGILVCRTHLVEVEVDGQTRTYCRRHAWQRAFWQMLLGL